MISRPSGDAELSMPHLQVRLELGILVESATVSNVAFAPHITLVVLVWTLTSQQASSDFLLGSYSFPRC